MTAACYETDDQDPTAVGVGLLMAGAVAFVWGAGCIALTAAAVDWLWRRGRR